ncbi:MAG: protein kinase domain-containing protein [Phycisphaerales bacterium]
MKSLDNFEASLVFDGAGLVDEGSIRLADETVIQPGPEAVAPEAPSASQRVPSGSSLPAGAALTPQQAQPPGAPTAPDAGPDAQHAKWIGKRLAHFRIMRVLGQGAMGVVFQTEDVNLKRITALKVLRQQMRGEGVNLKVERFLLEARAAASIDHPSIAQVYEINQHEGWWYIAMEYLEGGSLQDVLKRTGPLPPSRAALMLADGARGLAAAHEAGVIHRDVKPANLMLTRRGRCKVVDFGLVKLDSGENLFGDDLAVLGTPHYIAPEVVLKRGAGPASDIYSLGATAYVLLAGATPFSGPNVEAIMQARLSADAPDIRASAPSVPASIAELIRMAMDRDPEKRPSAEVFAAAMQVELSRGADEGAGPTSVLVGGSLSAPGTAVFGQVGGGSIPAPGHTSTASAAAPSLSLPSAEPTPRIPEPRRSMAPWLAAAGIALAAVVGLTGWLLSRSGTKEGAKLAVAPAPSAIPASPAAAAPVPPRESITNSIGMRLVSLPTGTFAMGSPASESDRNTDERTVQVTLTKPVFMSATEVTQQQWADVMGADYTPPEGTHPNEAMGLRFVGPSLPAYSSWHEAKEFCRRLSEIEKKTYRLPSEAEWEHACRAGTGTAFSFGSSLEPSHAAFDAFELTGKPSRPTAVATFPPNPWGLYDMHGNLMEWCADQYADYPLGPLTDPLSAGKERLRVLRGGSWDTPARVARSANRWANFPEVRTDYIGFRVVLEPGAPFVPEPAPPAPPKSEIKHIPLDAPDVNQGRHPEVDAGLPMYTPETVLSQRLRSVGSDTMDRLVRLWEQEFQRSHPGLMIKHEGRGSGTAPRALAEAIAHIGPMSRPLNEPEKREFLAQQGYEPTQLVVAFDALAVYVNATNPVATRGLSLEEVDALFSATRKRGAPREISVWSGLGLSGEWATRPVVLLGRNRASGTFAVFRELALKGGEYRPGMLELIGSAEVVDRAAEEPGAVGFSGIGYARPEVRAVPIVVSPGAPPIEPVLENVLSGAYPLSRGLYLTLDLPPGQPPSPWQREFLRFVLSRRGQELVAQAGFFPLEAEKAEAQLRAARILDEKSP